MLVGLGFSFLLIFDLIAIPPKLSGVILNSFNFRDFLDSDLSLMIRVANFEEAIKLSDAWTVFFGNGGKFFQLSSTVFFDENTSLDNTYLYLLLSFGLVGIFVFYLFFMSNTGMRIGGRGSLTFVALAFPILQDVFSNSFNLLTLSIVMAFDTVLYRHLYEMTFNVVPLNPLGSEAGHA